MAVNLHLYDTLLELDMFQGMSRTELSELVAYTKLGFHKISARQEFIHEGKPCKEIIFLLNGKVNIKRTADNHSYSIIEHLTAPLTINPTCLFGLSQHHTNSITAKTDCNLLSISKSEFIKLSDNFLAIRYNYLNQICNSAHKSARVLLRPHPKETKKQIIRFIEVRCLRPAGSKTVEIKMETLAHELSTSRLNISNELNSLQEKGLITLSRGKIYIPALEQLLM